MKKIYPLLISIALGTSINGQVLDNISIGLESNTAWYNNDSKTGDFFDQENNNGDKHIRSNNYLKIDYRFMEAFTATLQIESYEPFALINYSKSYKGTDVGIYNLNYKNKKTNISIGHFYTQFGSGLILRNWEDRQLGINNAILGGKISHNPTNFIALTALYGKQRNGFTTSAGELFGFNSELDLATLLDFGKTALSLGFSYVGRKENTKIVAPSFEELTNSFSARVDFNQANFYWSAEYVTKSEDAVVQTRQVSNNFIKSGSALLFNTGYSQKGFGIDATFRRLENISFYSERKTAGNVFNENLINYTPSLTKQHDYLLTNIFVYQAQSGVSFFDPGVLKVGEIGGQLDLFYKINKETFFGGKYGAKIALNAAYWAGLKGNYDFANQDYDVDVFGFGGKYFSEFSIEIRKKWSPKWRSILYFVNQSYNKKDIETNFGAGTINSNIAVFESTHKLGKGKALRFEIQKLSSDSSKHDWTGSTLEYNLNSKFSVYINDIYNSGDDSETKETHFYNLGGSYTKGATRLSLNYGRQRAGLLCVGGVCRFVAEATGLTANLSMSL